MQAAGFRIIGPEAACQADFVLLPMSQERVSDAVARTLQGVRPGTLLLAGRPGSPIQAAARQASLPLLDYFQRPELECLNAVPTAEGCLALLLQLRRRTIWESDFLVLGYGRIGRAVARRLDLLGGHTTVAARNAVQRANARCAGHRAAPLDRLPVLLAKHGYRVLGVDRSEEMLTVAAEKAMELEENQPFFVAQPMQRLRIPEPVDACVCALDSINYVTKPQDVQKAFRRVYESLRPGGLFVFDINTPYKLESLDGQVFLDETEDSYCVWRAVYDKRHSLCRYGMDLFQRLEDETWERSFEEHVERAYTPEELSGWLADAGFAQIEQFGNLRLEAPENTELRIFFAAKKG